MNLYLIRHAHAVDINKITIHNDFERYLSEDGMNQIRTAARFFVSNRIEPDMIITSPLKRSVQSAELLKQSAGFKAPINKEEDLKPGAPPSIIMDIVRRYKSAENLAVVGHQPDLGRFVSYAISGGSIESELAIKPAGMCMLELESPLFTKPGRLRFLIDPSLLKK